MKLSINALSFAFSKKQPLIFDEVSFGVEKGQMVSILGPNGAGKSTLLNCIGGLLEPQRGAILLDGKDLKDQSSMELARHIGYVPQSHTPVYDYTVEEFVVMGRTPHIGAFASPRSSDYAKVTEALDLVGAGHLLKKPYTRISGGERQLATIARAIVQEPDFILLDEPTAHLDFGNQMKVVRLAKALTEQGFGILMTTHNPDQVFYSGGKVAMLNRCGQLIDGVAEEILTEGVLSALYREPIHVFYSEELGRMVCLAGAAKVKRKENR